MVKLVITKQLCILHVCGGDPKVEGVFDDIRQYSPRMWR